MAAPKVLTISARPRLPGWTFAAHWQPARQVAGDYYDFILLPGRPPPAASRLGAPQLGAVIADVSDKGAPAALFMAMVRSTVRASVAHTASPAEGIALANRLICADAGGGMFVTLFYAQLDSRTGEMVYVNAGHNPPLFVRAAAAADDCVTELRRTGMALGVMADASFKQRTVRFDPRDLVLLYTDGITDALDRRERGFGVRRLQEVLVRRRDAPVADLIAADEPELLTYVGDLSPFDDVTMVATRRR